jgi:hypothetical protein
MSDLYKTKEDAEADAAGWQKRAEKAEAELAELKRAYDSLDAENKQIFCEQRKLKAELDRLKRIVALWIGFHEDLNALLELQSMIELKPNDLLLESARAIAGE